MSAADGFLRHPLLTACRVAYGFGLRGSPEPQGLLRPRQVHGAGVAQVHADGAEGLGAADAIVSDVADVCVGVVSADCVPVLLATPSGGCVAAVHAGWRGLARGVIAASVQQLRATTPEAAQAVAVVGPCVGPCCYEIDTPVVEALAARLGDAVHGVLTAAHAGHWRLDLGEAVRLELERAGVHRERIARIPRACTACDPVRFHSYRRDGRGAGRLVHFVAAREPRAGPKERLDSRGDPP
jgi:YfiH family protein